MRVERDRGDGHLGTLARRDYLAGADRDAAFVIGGDFNLVPAALDGWQGDAAVRSIFCTAEQRSRYRSFLDSGAHGPVSPPAPGGGTAPWQKPWQPGERILPHNFGSSRDYGGGNAVYLAVEALENGYADPRWGGYRQIQEAGGQVRKGEKGTPILYVEWRSRRTARDEGGRPVLDEAGRPERVWVERDRPLVKLHHVFNVEQAEGLRLPSLAAATPAWEGHERAEAVLRNSGVRIDHVAGDRAY